MPTKDEMKDFGTKIEELVNKLRVNHIDAIMYHCEQTGMEIEVASSLVSSALKAKLKEDAQELNLLKKTSRLPI